MGMEVEEEEEVVVCSAFNVVDRSVAAVTNSVLSVVSGREIPRFNGS